MKDYYFSLRLVIRANSEEEARDVIKRLTLSNFSLLTQEEQHHIQNFHADPEPITAVEPFKPII